MALPLILGVVWLIASGGALPGYPDLFLYVIPEHWFNHRAFSSGFIPFWNPDLFCGTPHTAYFKPAVFYPPTWLMDPRSGCGILAVFGILHGTWGALGFWFFQRQMGTPGWVAIGPAWAFGACGQVVFNWACPAICAGIVWIPWLFAALAHLLRRGDRISTVLLALVGSFQVLSGYPQTALWTWAAAALWLLGRGASRRIWGSFFSAWVLAGLCTCAQWLPFLERLSADLRPAWVLDYYSFGFRDFGTLLWPGIHRDGGAAGGFKVFSTSHFNLYAGYLPFMLACVALIRGTGGEASFWARLCVIVGLWCVGGGWPGLGEGFLREWIVKMEPCKASVLIPFGICAAAGGLLKELYARKAISRRRVMFLIVLMGVDSFTVPYRILEPCPDPYGTRTESERTAEMLGLLSGGRMVSDPHTLKSTLSRRAAGVPTVYAESMVENTNVPAGIASVGGNASFLTRNANHLAELFYGRFPGPGAVPDVASCRVAVTPIRLKAPWTVLRLRDGMVWNENPDALPRVRLVRFVRIFPERAGLFYDLGKTNVDTQDTAWIEQPGGFGPVALPKPLRGLTGQVGGDPARGGLEPIQSARSGPNRMTASWNEVSGGFLVWNESFETGWRAWLDGKPASILRAYGLFQAVGIPQGGAHRVEFRYEPAVFRLGLFISLLAFSFLVVNLVISYRWSVISSSRDRQLMAAPRAAARILWVL